MVKKFENFLNENISNGWDEDELSELMDILDDIVDLQYEIKHCARGVKTKCKTYDQLGEYIEELGTRLAEFGDSIQEYVIEGDEDGPDED